MRVPCRRATSVFLNIIVCALPNMILGFIQVAVYAEAVFRTPLHRFHGFGDGFRRALRLRFPEVLTPDQMYGGPAEARVLAMK